MISPMILIAFIDVFSVVELKMCVFSAFNSS